jgi:hypothetical protein
MGINFLPKQEWYKRAMNGNEIMPLFTKVKKGYIRSYIVIMRRV